MSNDLEMSRQEHSDFYFKCIVAHAKSRAAGRALKRIRINACLTKEELAERMTKQSEFTVTAANVNDFEAGKCTIDPYWEFVITKSIGVES